MIAVGLDRQKFDSQRTKLQFLLSKKLKDLRDEVEKKTRLVAADICFALMVNTMPSEQSGIGKAIANIKHDARNGLLTEGEAFQILEKEKSRRIASAFYAAFKTGNLAKAQTILRNSQSSISHYEVGSPEKIDPDKINYPKNRVISKHDMEVYLKKVVIRLGKTASGWGACLERLGFDGNYPRWKGTAIHGSDGGSVNFIHSKTKVTIWLANNRPLARKLINPSQVRRIVKDREEHLKDWLQRRS